jgi:hypothetical protein
MIGNGFEIRLNLITPIFRQQPRINGKVNIALLSINGVKIFGRVIRITIQSFGRVFPAGCIIGYCYRTFPQGRKGFAYRYPPTPSIDNITIFSSSISDLEYVFSNSTPQLKSEDPNATFALTDTADNKKAVTENNRTAKIEVGLMSLFVISLILTDYRVTFNAVAKVTAVFLAVAVGIHARRESLTYEAHNLSRAY